jgi:hypothetical protein
MCKILKLALRTGQTLRHIGKELANEADMWDQDRIDDETLKVRPIAVSSYKENSGS